MKYRKRPIVVEAKQVGSEPWEALEKWCGGVIVKDGRKYVWIVIRTHEGDMRADIGDWIIEEPNPTDDRRFYPCKPDIFAKTYEPA